MYPLLGRPLLQLLLLVPLLVKVLLLVPLLLLLLVVQARVWVMPAVAAAGAQGLLLALGREIRRG